MSAYGFRVCAACHSDLRQGDFSKSQWSRGAGKSRCIDCVASGASSAIGDPTARRNNSSDGHIDWSAPLAEGAFRLVYNATYSGGARHGQRGVIKVFKSGAVFAASHFDAELAVVEKARHILGQWNGAGFCHEVFRLNIPDVWTLNSGERVLVEPYIDGFQKFNSNTGWRVAGRPDGWSSLMQALSHYSYHVSGGQYLLCDLQGGIVGGAPILTDPVVQSRDRRFGPTDLGPDGIASFFAGHACSSWCRAEWTAPRGTGRARHAPVAATTMIGHGDATGQGRGGYGYGGGVLSSVAEQYDDSDSSSDY